MFAPRWTAPMQITALVVSIGWPTILPGQQPAAPQSKAPQFKAVQAKGPSIPEGVKVLRDLEYGRVGDRSLILDLYLPEMGDRPLPLIIWVHGGGWAAGSKEQVGAVRQLQRGYAVASVGYRLSGEAVFPAQIEDCKAAVRWLRAHATKYGLDPDHFGAWGSSAGGHLVTLLGMSGGAKEFDTGGHLDQSSRVQAVCDFYGPTDFLQMDAHAPPGATLKHNAPQSPEARLIGGPIQENRPKSGRANPISYLSDGAPPFLIVHGDQDATVPHHQSELLYEALQAAGRQVRFHTVEGGGHGVGIGGPEVDRAVDQFFDRHLKGIGGSEPHGAVRTQSAAPMRLAKAARTDELRTDLSAREQPAGLLFFASYPERDNAAPTTNPHIVGALHTIYWSSVEPRDGQFDWADIDQRLARWTKANKKVALRIMWSSSGNWPEPAAKHPTPPWVLDKGAVTVHSNSSNTDIPLIWDPVYRKYALRFLQEVARKFDGDPNVLFIDVTPGAETNPYRFRRINVQEPQFKQRFAETAASDGRKYSHELWLETVKQAVSDATGVIKKTKLLVTLNVGSLDGPSQMQPIGDHCVALGCYVGQNGLRGNNYSKDGPRASPFLTWGQKTKLYFEMLDATSAGTTGPLMDVMKRAESIGCDYLGVYSADVLKGTPGQPSYDAEYEKALEYGARALGKR